MGIYLSRTVQTELAVDEDCILGREDANRVSVCVALQVCIITCSELLLLLGRSCAQP